MSLQSHAVLLPYRDSSIRNVQLHRINRLLVIHNPVGLRWIKRRLVVTNAAERREESSKEIRLDNRDLMALEFGRLLGESKEKTMSKVIRRKMDPGATYIGIEKTAKRGKESLSEVDYGVKIESPKRAAVNNGMRQKTSGIPTLASPPMRQNGSSINFPQTVKVGARAAPQLDTQEILDDSLLRKPSLSQSSTVPALPRVAFTSPALGSRKRQGSESAKDRSIDDEMLRRPSMIKENKEIGENSLNSSNQIKENGSVLHAKAVTSGFVGIRPITEKSSTQRVQREVSTVSEDNESMEASKREFQRLLDESSNPSPASSLPNLASPPVRQSNSLGKSLRTTQKETRVKLSSPERTHLGTDEKALVLQPEGDQPSDDVVPSSTLQIPDSQDDEPFEASKLKFQRMLDTSSVLPNLASPPSRHKGSRGTFFQPARAGTRATRSSIKSPTYELVDESLLRKPTVNQSQTGDMATTSPTEATSPVSLSRKMQSFESADEGIDDNLLRRPLMTKSDTEIYVKPSDINNVLQQDGTGMNEEKAFLPRSQAELSLATQDNVIEEKLLVADLKEQGVQDDLSQMFEVEKSVQIAMGSSVGQDKPFATVFKERLVIEVPSLEAKSSPKTERSAQLHVKHWRPKPSYGLDSSSEMNNKMSNAAQSGGVQDVDHSPVVKGVKAPALKKPVRVSSSGEAVAHASEVSSVPSNTSLDPESNSYLFQQSGVKTAVGEVNRLAKLDIVTDLRPLQTEHKVEEASETQRLTEQVSVASLQSQKTPSEEDQKKQQKTHERLIEVQEVDQTKEGLHDGVPADSTGSLSAAKEVLDNRLAQSKKILRKPTQPTYAELSLPHLQQKGLGVSDMKWHQAKEDEEKEWTRADTLLKSKEHVEVKLIGSNSAGLFVSFGCLVGFLPSFELSPKRGLVDFSSWAQHKGIDLGRKSGSINGGVNDAGQSNTASWKAENGRLNTLTEGDLEELRNKHKEEVSKLMSTFVGEKARVIVKLLDKSGRRLKFSEKEADPDSRELVQRKADLMAELKVGDVVICEVKSITPIGVFVELDGVSALIHHSEVSWNTRVDPTSLLSIGKVIKARVCRLDRTLQRINLSLKQMQTDPLKLTLESVVGDSESDASMHELEAIESEAVVWPELEDLIKKLEQMEDISCVSKGRCLHSAALAPTFQVFLSTPQIDGYKLLARFGNKIQEVLVNTTLDREKMKGCIRLCTFAEA